MILLVVPLLLSQCQKERDHLLIYTRNGDGYVHDNIEASVDALKELCADLDCTFDVSDEAALFTSENLARYDGLVFANTNNEAFETEAQRNAFKTYIQGGGAFMGIHSACASERDWPWFWAMLGGKFVRHPKYQEFDIRIIDSQHSSTRHLPATWQWEDECYYMDQLNPDIHVLLAAELLTVKDSMRVAYPGTTFGDLFPLAWIHEYDGGRQFYTALGHSIEHYDDPLFREHLKGGMKWILKKNGG